MPDKNAETPGEGTRPTGWHAGVDSVLGWKLKNLRMSMSMRMRMNKLGNVLAKGVVAGYEPVHRPCIPLLCDSSHAGEYGTGLKKVLVRH